ncbi:GALM isoform 3 [Pongo abelii]|uniref:Galactose mutarotase n=1 Tax=Pongo abelii TaxID=9601 RepID=A0A2J8SWN5_PONAB|nr:GALM isoform 3 [Pongo abelii]
MASVTRAVFGELPSGGGTVEKFQLQSDLLRVDIISWGCTITALEVKDRQGRSSDVVLGFAELEGEVAPVQGTAFDLRKPVELGKHLQDFHLNGFDHNFCLKGSKEKHFCARVHHAASGRVLEVYTTQPGVQFYMGNFLDGTLKGKNGAVYPKHSGFCLETQNWPDAVNQPRFPPVLLRPGEEYDHTTWFKFSVA